MICHEKMLTISHSEKYRTERGKRVWETKFQITWTRATRSKHVSKSTWVLLSFKHITDWGIFAEINTCGWHYVSELDTSPVNNIWITKYILTYLWSVRVKAWKSWIRMWKFQMFQDYLERLSMEKPPLSSTRFVSGVLHDVSLHVTLWVYHYTYVFPWPTDHPRESCHGKPPGAEAEGREMSRGPRATCSSFSARVTVHGCTPAHPLAWAALPPEDNTFEMHIVA